MQSKYPRKKSPTLVEKPKQIIDSNASSSDEKDPQNFNEGVKLNPTHPPYVNGWRKYHSGGYQGL
ncbi:MAG TPA: hypothetical protein VEZ55_01785 [Chitinophagaceae bacterium]|jgi:hypothetical protein|nr:hypothetical protein [Chitinophagaceae bacterium]